MWALWLMEKFFETLCNNISNQFDFGIASAEWQTLRITESVVNFDILFSDNRSKVTSAQWEPRGQKLNCQTGSSSPICKRVALSKQPWLWREK